MESASCSWYVHKQSLPLLHISIRTTVYEQRGEQRMRCYRFTYYCPNQPKQLCCPIEPKEHPLPTTELCHRSQPPQPPQTKVEVTFFDRIGDDFVRSCTTICREDGSCAKGTLLDRNCSAYVNLMNGLDYVGEVVLFGQRYFPKYAPIKNKEGRVIGAICVGKCIS